VIHEALGRPVPVELTDDPRMTRRVRRLAGVSVVALGLIWSLAGATTAAPGVVLWLLLGGWVLMPSTLVLSLAAPRTRYLLAVPASLVMLALAAICVAWLPARPIAAAGWLLLTGGIALGAWLGLWLWFRIVAVPTVLEEPDSRARLGLISVHVALIVAGWLLAVTELLPG